MKRTVTRVIDGDTFVVNRKINGTNYVRLANVNAPEKYARGGRTATNVLKGMIAGRTITVNPVGRNYNRIVATASYHRKSINRKLQQKRY
jgi:endonuclease YncB( thermonuclease family)